jgi:hypothetical protein
VSKLKRNLKIIWAETVQHEAARDNPGAKRRYIAKALPNRQQGSGGWGVYDKQTSRFLKDAEVRGLSEHQVRESWLQ